MIETLIHLLGGYTKTEYEEAIKNTAEQYSNLTDQTKYIQALENNLKEYRNTPINKFTLCVKGGQVWID